MLLLLPSGINRTKDKSNGEKEAVLSPVLLIYILIIWGLHLAITVPADVLAPVVLCHSQVHAVLPWRHDERDGNSNHRHLRLFIQPVFTDKGISIIKIRLTTSVGNSHRSAGPRPTTLEEDRKLFVDFSSIICLWCETQGMRTFNFFDWVSNTANDRLIFIVGISIPARHLYIDTVLCIL